MLFLNVFVQVYVSDWQWCSNAGNGSRKAVAVLMTMNVAVTYKPQISVYERVSALNGLQNRTLVANTVQCDVVMDVAQTAHNMQIIKQVKNAGAHPISLHNCHHY